MRYHTEHAPRHTKSVAHTGNKMRNIKNQLLGWVLIACLVCTTVALPTQRTDAFVPVAPLVAPAIGSAVTTYSPVVVGFFTAYAAYTAGTIKDKITQEACRKNFGQNICQNVNPVSAVSAITVAAMVISDTCKGMDVVTCGKKLWEKLSKFIQEMLNKSKVTNGKFTIDRLKKCFNNLSCTQKDWAFVFQPSGATKPSKTPITPKSQQGSGGSTTAKTTSTKPQTTASQNKPTPTKKSRLSPADAQIIDKLISGYKSTIEKMEQQVKNSTGPDKEKAQNKLKKLKLDLSILLKNKAHYLESDFVAIRGELQIFKNNLDLAQAFIESMVLQRDILVELKKIDASSKQLLNKQELEQLEEKRKKLVGLFDEIQNKNDQFSKEISNNSGNASMIQKSVTTYRKSLDQFREVLDKKPSTTLPVSPYPGIHSKEGKALFEQMEERERILKTQKEKRRDLSPLQKEQIEEELKRINKTKSTLSNMQKRMEEQNKGGPTFSQTDNNEIQATIKEEQGVLKTLAEITNQVLGFTAKLGTNQAKQMALLNMKYTDAGMGRSGGLDNLSDSVTAQLGDPSMRVETGKCWGPDIDNNTIATDLLQRKDTMDKKHGITKLTLVQTAYGLMLQGVQHGKIIYILPCVPIVGYNVFFVGTMEKLEELLKDAQAQGKLRYGVKGNAIKKVTKLL